MTTLDLTVESRCCPPHRQGGLVRRLVVPCLLLLAAACYWGLLDTFFVQDDFMFLAAARKPMPNLEMLRGSCFFRPLSTYWLTLLNVSLWGFSPFGHHLTHLAIFLATVGLLYRWLLEVTGRSTAALVGAGLYAFSKTHLYTLAWISGGIDVLAALFFILCLWAVDRYLKQSADGGGTTNHRLLGAIGITLVCGVLCKESCVVLMPVCLGWMAARRFFANHPFGKAELRLAVLMVAVVAVYLPLWKLASNAAGTPKSQLTFAPSRGVNVLQDSVIALVPVGELSLPKTAWWLLPVLGLTALAAMNRRGRNGYLVLGLLLWTLPAAMFVFTKYPWALQLYYAHFNIIGLTVLAALAIASVQNGLDAWGRRAELKNLHSTAISQRLAGLSRGRVALRCLGLALLAVWIGFAARTIRTGIRQHASPALYEAEYSKAAYDQLHIWLQDGSYRRIVFLDAAGLLWASLQYGDMIPALFPEVSVACDGKDGFRWSESARASPTTLVVRQTGERSLTIVR